jgi:hypothetical protein
MHARKATLSVPVALRRPALACSETRDVMLLAFDQSLGKLSNWTDTDGQPPGSAIRNITTRDMQSLPDWLGNRWPKIVNIRYVQLKILSAISVTYPPLA